MGSRSYGDDDGDHDHGLVLYDHRLHTDVWTIRSSSGVGAHSGRYPLHRSLQPVLASGDGLAFRSDWTSPAPHRLHLCHAADRLSSHAVVGARTLVHAFTSRRTVVFVSLRQLQ